MGSCIIYLRVSSSGQSTNSSFVRQLDSCVSAARSLRLNVSGIFGDTCSGDSGMPNRTLAYLQAKHRRCPILVETMDRWSRMRPGRDPLTDVEVFVCSESVSEGHMLPRIYQNSLGVAAVPRLIEEARG
jgi:DNA invertase Pin-like site-specific DNA recombinase